MLYAMKKVLFFLLSLCLFAPLSFAQTGGDDPLDIIITNGNQGGDQNHHAPALTPIQAAYYPSITTILVDFLYDLGQVSVEIENETTGGYSQTTINAMQGVQPFIITGASGIYELTFTLANGIVYIGSFEIE